MRADGEYARVAELADALDLGSSSGDGMGVQVSPLAPKYLSFPDCLIEILTRFSGVFRCRKRLHARDLPSSIETITDTTYPFKLK